MEYTAGDARTRQRIGRSIYAAIEALADSLDTGGPQSRRLAVELQGGLTEMLEARAEADRDASGGATRDAE